MEIYNSTGEKITTQSIDGKKSQIDVSSFKSGIYLLKIESSTKVEVLRFLKN